ncbi:MAG TPA: PAS domain-containing protein [Allosphingosinicella sp.]
MAPVIHIVDDDAHVRAATSYLLTGQGYTTEVYAGGEELLAQPKLRDGCVLLDLRMPGLSGAAVMAQIAARDGALPVIMMSGHGDLRDAVQAMKLGAVDFLEKPYQEAELIAAIERALDGALRSRDRRETRSAAAARLACLSSRERQVLQGLLAGMTNKAIARALQLSPRTVEMHRANMMDDLGLTSLSEALHLAIEAELAPLEGADAPPKALASSSFEGVQDGRPAGPEQPDTGVLPAVLDVLEGTTECVFLLDDDWRFSYLNRNAAEMFGVDRDLKGKVIWQAFPLSVGTRAWEQLHRVASDRQALRFQFFEPDLELWLDVNARPMDSGLQVFFRDVSAERKATASLRISEEALLLALEATGDGAWDWDIPTGNIAMSPRFLERLGYDPDAMPGRFEAVRQLVHPDDLARVSEQLSNHLEGRTPTFECEYRVRRSQGGWCWNFDRGRVVARDPLSGLPVRMVGSACDVTALRGSEERAREAFERIAVAQESAGAGTWDLDLATRIVRLCPRSLEMHGLAPDAAETLTEKEWQATLHPDDVARVHDALEASVEHGTVYRAEFRTIGADGRCRWVLGLGKTVADSRGNACRFVGLNQDVTERAEADMELKRVQTEVVHLSRLSAMGAMAATLAHELNQPLTAIANFTRGLGRSLGQAGGDVPDTVLDALSGAERSAEYAAEILRRLREHAADREPAKRPESLAALVEGACRIAGACSPEAARPEVSIAADADLVLADPIQIEQVLLNLIRNAQEAAAENASGHPVEISVRRSSAGDAEIRVSDQGPGLSEDQKALLFTPFASSKSGGLGIGLSICRTIVNSHAGRIWVEDNVPNGASFCFSLPLASRA